MSGCRRTRTCSSTRNSQRRTTLLNVSHDKESVSHRDVYNSKCSTLSPDLSGMLLDRSALALVNGQLWDLHRPLVEDCTVELLHFHAEEPFHVNRAFWRSCSFMLGAVMETVFKEDVFKGLHSFPAPNGETNSTVEMGAIKIPPFNAGFPCASKFKTESHSSCQRLVRPRCRFGPRVLGS